MKQPLYVNRAIDFTKLTDREFEEIVYFYFKEQISRGFYLDIYDNVELSSGVGERGVDCILFNKGIVKGAVQCKNYKTNLSKKIIFDEIIKFLLFHVVEIQKTGSGSSFLIDNINDFTYYIVASKDFSQETKYLLSDFNKNWKNFDIIDSIKKLISSTKSFEELNLNETTNKLTVLLDNINIVSFKGLDIDIIVRSNQDIIQKYFSSETLLNKETVDNIKEIKKSVVLKPISSQELFSKAKSISEDIGRVKRYFGKDSRLRIDRKEVDDIIYWIKKRLSDREANVAVVSGNAGLGKSVILSQLYSKLIDQNIPVLSLKADRLIFESIKEFEGEIIDLGISINEFMNQLIGDNKEGVLIIDQIDALSQTLSSNLKPLKAYDRLIRKLIDNKNIKIIISCRIYDLNYDPIIAEYKGKKNFIIKPIERDKLLNILDSAGITKLNQFSNTFLDLLSIPLHLDVFLKIYSRTLELSQITNLQDLYSELWKQKIITNKTLSEIDFDFEKVIKLIFRISEKMYEIQQINISSISFEDTFPRELEYLKTEGILKGENRIEFFHQSFFDYSFARNFVNQEKNLIEDIKSIHQGLFIRSKAKQILNFKRNTEPQDYINDLNEIVESSEIRFHLKLLILQQVAFQDEPTVLEKEFVSGIIDKHGELKSVFLSLYLGIGWLNYFITSKILDIDIKNNHKGNEHQIKTLFRKFIGREGDQLAHYYFTLEDSEIADQLILDLLWGTENIKDELYIELAKRVFKKNNNLLNEYWWFSILEHSLNNFPDWVSQIIIQNLKIEKGVNVDDDKNYFPGGNQYHRIYELFWEKYPRKAYSLVKLIIKEIIKNRSYESRGNIKLAQPYILYARKNLDLYFHYQQLDKIQQYLEEEFINDPNFVHLEVSTYLKSNFFTDILVGLSVINEHPNAFIDESFLFFSDKDKLIELFNVSEYLKFLINSTLGKLYHKYSLEEKLVIDNLLKDFYTKYEQQYIDYGNGKKIRNKSFGSSKHILLSSIIENGSINDENLHKEYLELKRKFGKIRNIEPEGVVVHIGDRNALEATVYEKLSYDDWKSTFRKYSKQNKDYDSWNQPDEIEHGRVFGSHVSSNPKEYINLVDQILIDVTIPNSYKVKGLEGLKDGGIECDILVDLFVKAIENNEFNDSQTLHLIWLTNYFAKQEKVYDEVLYFLKYNANVGNEKTNEYGDALATGINSVRGAAVNSLMDYSFSDKNAEYIFDILDSIVDNSYPTTRASAIYKLQNFIRFNEDKVLSLFLKLSSDYSLGIIKVALNPLQYLINYDFKALIPFFEKAILVKGSNDVIGNLLTRAYCYEYEGSEDLIKAFWKLGDDHINSSVKIAFEFVEHDVKINQALKVLNKFLDSENEDIAKSYNLAFHHFKVTVFEKLLDFLYKYTKSNVGKYREYSFYGYLLKCTNEHPHDCIRLASDFDTHFEPDIRKRWFKNEPLKVIIHSYNAIREYNTKDEILEYAMDTFDRLLKHNDYRDSAFEVLKDIDLY